MKKAYIQPVCEEINVKLFNSVLDQGQLTPWSEVAGGEYGDANSYTFSADEEENNKDDDDWDRIGQLWEN